MVVEDNKALGTGEQTDRFARRGNYVPGTYFLVLFDLGLFV